MRKTKIICTIGPASSDREALRQLTLAGMDVARLNCSHGTQEEYMKIISDLKGIREDTGIPLAILLDLKGPEIRTGTFERGKIFLHAGDDFAIYSYKIVGDESKMSVSYENFYQAVKPELTILIDDGLVELKVSEIKDKIVHTKVVVGGEVSNYKGVNLPNTPTLLPALDEKDISDLRFAVEQAVDFVAVSFARNAEDIFQTRNVLDEAGGQDINIIAKIENQQGIDNVDEIIEASDGLMVARGDLGVEIPPEQVPMIQKRLIRQCYLSGKPSITATQMLDSMIENPRPTRAEVSDVANAIVDGTSCLMLSGETAVGAYPLKAVEKMARIALSVEGEIDYWTDFENEPRYSCLDAPDALSHAAASTAKDLKASAIVVMTFSGLTARLISRFRPSCPILAMTVSEVSQHQLNMSWGVKPYLVPVASSTDAIFRQAVEVAKDFDGINCGDYIVLAGGSTSGQSGTTNTIRVEIMN
ncbi:MAG TPA: pyruvate kinase [Clostridiaceae bacterium]|nr:pyruvate kinase [Clostridiaceae bacterium]